MWLLGGLTTIAGGVDHAIDVELAAQRRVEGRTQGSALLEDRARGGEGGDKGQGEEGEFHFGLVLTSIVVLIQAVDSMVWLGGQTDEWIARESSLKSRWPSSIIYPRDGIALMSASPRRRLILSNQTRSHSRSLLS